MEWAVLITFVVLFHDVIIAVFVFLVVGLLWALRLVEVEIERR